MASLPETDLSVNPVPAAAGPVEVELQFDLTLLTLREQNEFLRAMDAAGFGNPSEGHYASLSPPTLAGPLRRASFAFGEEDPGNVECSLDEAAGIAAKHQTWLVSVHLPPGEVHLPTCR